jgi:hypothetical protein
MNADARYETRTREVTPLKRFSIVAAIVVVALLVVVPVAFAGARPIGIATPDNAYTPTSTCEGCHAIIGPPTSPWPPNPYPDYAQTAHYASAENPLVIEENPTSCGGCHGANFDPSKALAMPANQETPTDADNPTETRVACASCHFGFTATHVGGSDPMAFGQFANPDVCGQCHDRQSASVDTYPVYNPTPPPDTTDQTLRYPVAYDPFTTLLSSVMNIGAQMPTWPGGYSAYAHERSGVQYNEMYQGWYSGPLPVPEGTSLPITHFNAWAVLNTLVPDTAVSANEKINLCGHCMSADQRILVEAGKLNVPADPTQAPTDALGNPVTKDQIKYGDSCVACHDPHKNGASKGVWDPDINPQLIMPRTQLCGSCHNGELPEGQTTFAPGAHIVHPTQEFMAGYGAIDVPQMPALHKGMCVQCHMVPTGFDRFGSPATGGNHIFTPIMPATAMDTTTTVSVTGGSPIAPGGATETDTTVTITTTNPINLDATAVGKNVTIAGVPVAGYNGTFAVTAVLSPTSFTYTNPVSGLAASGGGTVTYSSMPSKLHMPYSACSTCHEGTNGDNPSKTQAMQDLIDGRQAWTHDMADSIMATLDAKAVSFGYTDAAAAVADATFVADNVDFADAWTNVQIVMQEGSWGVHNWQYGVAILNKAMEQADAARGPVAGVSIKASASKVNFGQAITISGTVTTPSGGPALTKGDEVRLWVNGVATGYATLSGSNYTFSGIKPAKNTKFTIQFVGDKNYAPTVGDSTTVNIAYKVTITSNATSVKAGAKVTVQGTVAPTAGPVTIQRYVSGAWKTFKSGVSVNKQGRYSYTFATKKGTYKLRTVKAASSTLVQGTSGYRTITAK